MLTFHEQDERVLSDTELGTAISEVPAGYEGATLVQLQGRSSVSFVLPSVAQAEAAAKFGVGPLGGYHTARITPAPLQQPDYASWLTWAFT